MTPQEQAVIEQELRWYYLEADSQCGLRSIQSGLEAQANARALCKSQEGGIHLHETRSSNSEMDGLPAAMVEAAHRASRIHQVLSKIGTNNARTLELAFACTIHCEEISVDLLCETDPAVAGFAAARRAVAKALADKMPRRAFRPVSRLQDDRDGYAQQTIVRHPDTEELFSDARSGEWYGVDQSPTALTLAQKRRAADILAKRIEKKAKAKAKDKTAESEKGPVEDRTVGMTTRSWLGWLVNIAEKNAASPQAELLAKILVNAKVRLRVALDSYDTARRRGA